MKNRESMIKYDSNFSCPWCQLFNKCTTWLLFWWISLYVILYVKTQHPPKHLKLDKPQAIANLIKHVVITILLDYHAVTWVIADHYSLITIIYWK